MTPSARALSNRQQPAVSGAGRHQWHIVSLPPPPMFVLRINSSRGACANILRGSVLRNSRARRFWQRGVVLPRRVLDHCGGLFHKCGTAPRFEPSCSRSMFRWKHGRSDDRGLGARRAPWFNQRMRATVTNGTTLVEICHVPLRLGTGALTTTPLQIFALASARTQETTRHSSTPSFSTPLRLPKRWPTAGQCGCACKAGQHTLATMKHEHCRSWAGTALTSADGVHTGERNGTHEPLAHGDPRSLSVRAHGPTHGRRLDAAAAG